MVIFYIFLILTIFALDNGIKKKVEDSKSLPHSIWKGRVYIQKYHNKGAFWNLGERHPKTVMFISVLMTVLIFMIFLCSLGQKGNGLLRLGLSAILGGAFSNTYDRVKRHYVVDYINLQVKWKLLARTVFNISDFFIMLGVMMCCLGSLQMK